MVWEAWKLGSRRQAFSRDNKDLRCYSVRRKGVEIFDISLGKDDRSRREYIMGFGGPARKERTHEAVEILEGADGIGLVPSGDR